MTTVTDAQNALDALDAALIGASSSDAAAGGTIRGTLADAITKYNTDSSVYAGALTAFNTALATWQGQRATHLADVDGACRSAENELITTFNVDPVFFFTNGNELGVTLAPDAAIPADFTLDVPTTPASVTLGGTVTVTSKELGVFANTLESQIERFTGEDVNVQVRRGTGATLESLRGHSELRLVDVSISGTPSGTTSWTPLTGGTGGALIAARDRCRNLLAMLHTDISSHPPPTHPLGVIEAALVAAQSDLSDFFKNRPTLTAAPPSESSLDGPTKNAVEFTRYLGF